MKKQIGNQLIDLTEEEIEKMEISALKKEQEQIQIPVQNSQEDRIKNLEEELKATKILLGVIE